MPTAGCVAAPRNEGLACDDACSVTGCACASGLCTSPSGCNQAAMCCEDDFEAECGSGGSYWVSITLASGQPKVLRCFVGAQGIPDCERDAQGALVFYAAEDAVCTP